MTRAMLPLSVIDESGEDVENATIVYLNTDGTPIGVSLYAAQSGGSPVTTHTTDSLGEIVRYIDVPKRATYTVNGGTARPGDFSPDPATVIVASDTQARTLDGYTGTDPVLKLRSRNAAGTGLLVANTNDDTVLTVKRASSNDVVIVGDDGSTPTDTKLYVVESAATSRNLATVHQNVTAAGVIGSAFQATSRQTVNGISNVVGGRFFAERSAAATAVGSARAIEARIKTVAVGSVIGGYNVAVAALTDVVAAGVAPDAWYYAGGTGALPTYVLYAESAANVLVYAVSSGGIVTAGATAATTGQIRLPNATGITFRNALNTADLDLIRSEATNNVIVGANAGGAATVVLATTTASLQVGANVEFIASTAGATMGRSGGTVAFYGGAGVTKPAAYTQTAYSTATKTVAAVSATTVTNAFGTSDGTYQDTVGVSSAVNNNFQECSTRINQLIVDVANVKQVCNSIVDDLQALGLFQ